MIDNYKSEIGCDIFFLKFLYQGKEYNFSHFSTSFEVFFEKEKNPKIYVNEESICKGRIMNIIFETIMVILTKSFFIVKKE